MLVIKMKKYLNKIVCKFKGHDYPCPFFSLDTLCHCSRCGKEAMNRNINDLEPVSDDLIMGEEFFND